MAKKLVQLETPVHKSIVEWLEWILTPQTFFFHPANGGLRSKREAAKLKAMGVKPGVPDLMFVHDSVAFGIEIKGSNGVVSKAQRDCHANLNDAGVRVATCRSIDDVRNTLRGWNIPIREKMVA